MVSHTETDSGRAYAPTRVRRLTDFELTLPALVLLVLFFVVPVVILLMRSVTEPVPGLGNYVELLGSSTYLRIFTNTFLVSGLVTVVSLLIGFPVAWALAVMPGRAASIVFAILLLSMWTNLLARTYAWMVLLQRTGVINKVLIGLGLIDKPLPLVNNLTGVTIGMTYIMLPFIILPLYGVIKKNRSGDPAGGSTLRRQPMAITSPGSSALGSAWYGGRRAHGLRHVARLLRHPGTAWRNGQYDARRTHRPIRAVARQLGHGRCRGPGAPGRDACPLCGAVALLRHR